MLHIFGDSFSIPDTDKEKVFGPNKESVTYLPLEKSWTTIVNDSINNSAMYTNDAILGCSNDYIYQQIREKESLFKNGDCVIIQLTNLYREWFFENKPYMAVHMAVEMTAGVDVTEEQHKALEMYKRHLYSERRLILHYNALLDALSFRIKLWEDQGIKCLVLPAFHNLPGVEGNLCEVSGSEFDSEKTSMMYHEKTGDLRFNHFSEVNHKILADKIINFFTNNKNVNLKTGFETMLLTKDNI
tara:strand:+ start:92 stop:820 length:729 start_codon:yes stop_codon:yes gene_type:complete